MDQTIQFLETLTPSITFALNNSQSQISKPKILKNNYQSSLQYSNSINKQLKKQPTNEYKNNIDKKYKKIQKKQVTNYQNDDLFFQQFENNYLVIANEDNNSIKQNQLIQNQNDRISVLKDIKSKSLDNKSSRTGRYQNSRRLPLNNISFKYANLCKKQIKTTKLPKKIINQPPQQLTNIIIPIALQKPNQKNNCFTSNFLEKRNCSHQNYIFKDPLKSTTLQNWKKKRLEKLTNKYNKAIKNINIFQKPFRI